MSVSPIVTNVIKLHLANTLKNKSRAPPEELSKRVLNYNFLQMRGIQKNFEIALE